MHWRNLKIFSSRTTGSISTWHNASSGEGDSSLFKWRAPPFSKGHNSEIAKIHWQNLKIFLSRTTWPIATKLGTMHPCVKGVLVSSKEEPLNSHNVNNEFFLLINIMMFLRWVMWPMSLLFKFLTSFNAAYKLQRIYFKLKTSANLSLDFNAVIRINTTFYQMFIIKVTGWYKTDIQSIEEQHYLFTIYVQK